MPTKSSTTPPASSPVAKHSRAPSTPSTTTSPLPKRPKQMSSSAPYPAGQSLPLDLEPDPHSTSAIPASVVAESIPLQVKLLHPAAKPPTRGSAYSAGYDLYVAEAGTVPARGRAMLGTGCAIAIPPGTYARVAPRSGLAAKHGLATGAGVIDFDYRGEVKLLLFNHSDEDFKVEVGDRMAQLVLELIVNPQVQVVGELEGTERGAGGFGSTGGFGGRAVAEADVEAVVKSGLS